MIFHADLEAGPLSPAHGRLKRRDFVARLHRLEGPTRRTGMEMVESLHVSPFRCAVDRSGCAAIIEEQIRRRLLARLGAGLDVVIDNVAEVPAEREKLRYVVSHVPN